jgi:hypothetical protein
VASELRKQRDTRIHGAGRVIQIEKFAQGHAATAGEFRDHHTSIEARAR